MKDNILISVLIGTRNRIQPLVRCLQSVLSQDYPSFEVLVLDDCSQENICNILQNQITDSRLKCFRSERHLGVAGGRNLLMQKAQGEIFVVIDDDAYFDNCECLTCIINSFNQNPGVGILASKVINHQGGHTELFVPFSKRWLRKCPNLTEQTQVASYYLGTCHAIRRIVIERCGLYQEDLMYGGEELDLAYKAILAGFSILYVPYIVVHHLLEVSNLAQKAGKSEFYYNLRNKIWLAYKYLPNKYFVPHLFIWLSFYGVNAFKEHRVCEFIKGIWAGMSKLKPATRSPLSNKAITYLNTNFGRLWY